MRKYYFIVDLQLYAVVNRGRHIYLVTCGGRKMKYTCTLFVFVLSTLFNISTAKSEALSEGLNCRKTPVYIKIGEHHLKLPGGEFISIYGDESQFFSDCWASSTQNPIEAHRLDIWLTIELENFGELKHKIKIFHAENVRRSLSWAIEDLEERGLKFEDLEVRDGFYVYQKSGSTVKTYYKKLSDKENDYLIVNLCRSAEQALSCAASYNWKPSLQIFKVGTGSREKVPLSVQVKLREAVIENLNKLVYDPKERRKP